MFQDLSIFQTATAMAKHAGVRQSVVAQNIANADTPGFRAREVIPFEEMVKVTSQSTQLATRSGHLRFDGETQSSNITRFSESEPSPNGNSVSIEEEMLKAVGISQDHNRALAIYRHGMTVLRTALGR